MIVNRNLLLELAPIKDMERTKVSHNGVSHGLGELGYDIRIAEDVTFWEQLEYCKKLKANRLKRMVRVGTKVKEGRFALASAMEQFNMPARLGGIVHDKSTWARQGLSVFNTVIEPGWQGYLTLELVYHGEGYLFIPAGSGIAQVIFHDVLELAQYEGKYQNQEAGPQEARESK